MWHCTYTMMVIYNGDLQLTSNLVYRTYMMMVCYDVSLELTSNPYHHICDDNWNDTVVNWHCMPNGWQT